MKIEYKYIKFIQQPAKMITFRYACVNINSGTSLGMVKWYPHWRAYCFFPKEEELVFSAGCLSDIQDFINQLKTERNQIHERTHK